MLVTYIRILVHYSTEVRASICIYTIYINTYTRIHIHTYIHAYSSKQLTPGVVDGHHHTHEYTHAHMHTYIINQLTPGVVDGLMLGLGEKVVFV